MDFVMEINATCTRVARFDKNSEKMSVVLEIPSFIGWDEKNENWVVGDKAKNLSLTSPQNVLSVMDLILHINFPYIGKEKLSNKYLRKFLENIKERVQKITRERCEISIITIPDTLEYEQRKCLQEICEKVMGTPIKRMIGHARAVAISQYYRKMDSEGTFIVCHVGEVSSEIIVSEVGEGVVEVLATDVTKKFSGRKFTSKLVNECYKRAITEMDIKVPDEKEFLRQLFESIECMKSSWTTFAPIFVLLPYNIGNSYIELSLDCIKQIVEEMVVSLKHVICEILDEEVGVDIKEIDKIFISGEITAMFGIEEAVLKCTGCTTTSVKDIRLATIEGALIQWAKLSGSLRYGDHLFLDATVENYSIVDENGRGKVIITRNTSIPTKAEKVIKISSLHKERVFWITIGADEDPANNTKIEKIFIDKKYNSVEVVFDIDANLEFNWKINPHINWDNKKDSLEDEWDDSEW